MSGGTLSVERPSPTAVAFGDATLGTTVIVAGSDNTVNVSSSTAAPYTFEALSERAAATVRDIAHYDNIFVCVGDNGSIATVSVQQPNVLTNITSPTGSSLQGVTYDSDSGNFIAVGSDGAVIFSEDLGATWTVSVISGLSTRLQGVAANGDGGVYAVGNDGEGFLSTDGGETWSDVGTGASQTDHVWSVSGDASNWVICGQDGLIYKANPDCSSITEIVSPVTQTLIVALNNKLLLGLAGTTVSLNDALDTATDTTSPDQAETFYDGDYDAALGGYLGMSTSAIHFTETGASIPSWGVFQPLSDTYRANDFVILAGYVMLIGTSEYDSSTGKYKYHSRRVRWTAPNTIADFSGVGSGVGDLNGRGQLLFGEVVNERVILFESDSISTISATGLTGDPWNYEKIKEGLWSLSNPVVFGDNVYFVGSDGLIYATNGIDVSELGSSFDLTSYDDFDYTKPVIMAYSSEMSSLIIFTPSSPYSVHVVRPGTGQHSVIQLPAFTISTDPEVVYIPKTIISRNDNYLSTLMVAYVNRDGSSSDELSTVEFTFGSVALTGRDELSVSDTSYYDYYDMQIDTGNLLLNQEGLKQSVKHLLIRTYADGTTTGYIGAQVKSLEDDEWHSAGDPYATISVTDSTATVADSAVSNLIAEGDDVTTVFTTPCLGTQARVYFSTDSGTTYTSTSAYTVSDTRQITLDDALPTGTDLYVFWDNEPQIRIKTGDIILTTDGTHIVAGAADWNTPELDRYMSSGSDLGATHIPAESIAAGEGTAKIGINNLVEGLQIRIYVVPRTDSDCTAIQVSGISIGMLDTQAQKNETIK